MRTFIALCVLPSICLAAAPSQNATAPAFAALVERLSEPRGDFAGDNLISNEQSYLHVMPALERGKVRGGAYIGIGPDQNFSHIAQIKPEIAYIIEHADGTAALADEERQRIQTQLETVIKQYGVPLAPSDFEVIARSRKQFVAAGLSLVFQTQGRPRGRRSSIYRSADRNPVENRTSTASFRFRQSRRTRLRNFPRTLCDSTPHGY